MGNCQAAEAATVVIVHPGNKVERIYWSVSARQVMDSNPGHYVALVLASPVVKTEDGTPVKQLKLLRPDDTLLMGQVYRLVSFEDVLKEFAAKKCVKLGKLLKERGVLRMEEKKKESGAPTPNPNPKLNASSLEREHGVYRGGGSSSNGNGSGNGNGNRRVVGRQNQHQHHGGGGGVGQWKPALQSIAEIGT